MKEIKLDRKLGVCPKCGADTHKIEGKWKCKNCGHEEPIEE